jgi:hypothetical protein
MDWRGCGAGCCAGRHAEQPANTAAASRDFKTMDSPLMKMTSLSGKNSLTQPLREWADTFLPDDQW